MMAENVAMLTHDMIRLCIFWLKLKPCTVELIEGSPILLCYKPSTCRASSQSIHLSHGVNYLLCHYYVVCDMVA